MEGRKRALPIPGHMLRRCGLLSRTSLPLTKNGAVGLLPRGKYEPEAIDLVSESASASESDPPPHSVRIPCSRGADPSQTPTVFSFVAIARQLQASELEVIDLMSESELEVIGLVSESEPEAADTPEPEVIDLGSE